MPKIPIVNPASKQQHTGWYAETCVLPWDLPRIFLQLWSGYICSTYKKLDPLSVSDANFCESLTHTSPIHVADVIIRITYHISMNWNSKIQYNQRYNTRNLGTYVISMPFKWNFVVNGLENIVYLLPREQNQNIKIWIAGNITT